MTDPDLQALTDRVADLERRVKALDGLQGMAPVAPGSDPEIVRLMQEGNTIAAIKRYRELTGVGLAEAKQAVERIGLGFSPL